MVSLMAPSPGITLGTKMPGLVRVQAGVLVGRWLWAAPCIFGATWPLVSLDRASVSRLVAVLILVCSRARGDMSPTQGTPIDCESMGVRMGSGRRLDGASSMLLSGLR